MTARLAKRSLLVLTAALILQAGLALGDEAWRQEFDAACAGTTNAMDLSAQQLKDVLEKCDRVQKEIEKQDETVRKVYLKRLQMCRNLYVYVLEYKKNGQGAQ